MAESSDDARSKIVTLFELFEEKLDNDLLENIDQVPDGKVKSEQDPIATIVVERKKIRINVPIQITLTWPQLLALLAAAALLSHMNADQTIQQAVSVAAEILRHLPLR